MGDFFCSYCAGTGYTDYPTNMLPCPIYGHKEQGDRNVIEARNNLIEIHKNDLPTAGSKCPYCGREGKCGHWDGMGWIMKRI